MMFSAMSSFFAGKKVLVTGHTGFKGSWLCESLLLSGAIVSGFADRIPTKHTIYEDIFQSKRLEHDLRGNIQNIDAIKSAIDVTQPDILFHLAAQPLVIESYEDPLATWKTNTFGTINLLESLRSIEHKCICILITSDKSYKNIEQVWGYKESDELGGGDPYSASKAAAELAIQSYFSSFLSKKSNLRIGIARAGNVIGGGDWSENRIVPDCIKSWNDLIPVSLRNPYSTRPWQHVLEPLGGYMLLAEKLYKDNLLSGEAFNFGPKLEQNKSVFDLVSLLNEFYGGVGLQIPEGTIKHSKAECTLLKLNCEKAFHFLDWFPILTFDECVRLTSEWYKGYSIEPDSILKLTHDQILWYINKKYKSFGLC